MYGGGSNGNSGEACMMRASKILRLATYQIDAPVKTGEMSGICIKHGRGKICTWKTWT
jgi:hypothetical protein